jgi:hypothetical protein
VADLRVGEHLRVVVDRAARHTGGFEHLDPIVTSSETRRPNVSVNRGLPFVPQHLRHSMDNQRVPAGYSSRIPALRRPAK